MKLYLAGKVPKGTEIAGFEDWRSYYYERLGSLLGVELLTPVSSGIDESVPGLAFGFACSLIEECDVVIVDASQRLGVGTAQEFVVAKYFRKCVICHLPCDSPHRKRDLDMYGVVIEDWIHPFVLEMSDFVFETREEIAQMIESFCAVGAVNRLIKDLGVIDARIALYRERTKSRSS